MHLRIHACAGTVSPPSTDIYVFYDVHRVRDIHVDRCIGVNAPAYTRMHLAGSSFARESLPADN